MKEETDYDLTITAVTDKAPSCDSKIQSAVQAALQAHTIRSAQINVALVDDEEMAQLHEKHLGIPGPTDVITFNLSERSGAKPDTDSQTSAEKTQPIDGEIVISVDTALRESQTRAHDLASELALYAVHGTLHLLGYDDNTPEEAARMHKKEDEILSSIGMGTVYDSPSD